MLNFSKQPQANAIPATLRRVAGAAFLICAWPLCSAQSLMQLTEQAQSYDAAWQSSRAQYEATLSRSAQARAGLLPQVGIQAGSQYSHTRVHGSFLSQQVNGRQDSASLQASQPLYNPASYATYQQGELQARLAQIQLDAAAQELIIRTAKAYFQVLTAQENLQLVRAQQRSVAEQHAYAMWRFEIGDATITDAREAQSRLDLIRAQEIAAENDVRVAQAALDELLGTRNATPWPLAEPVRLPELTPASPDAWLDLALSRNPQILGAQIAVDMARLETEKAYAGHKPTVDLQASYSHQRNPDGTLSLPQSSHTHSGSVGVVMQIPLFAGFAVQNRVRETVSLEDKARSDLEDTRRKISQSVRAAFFGVQSAYEQVKALETAVASSRSALEANMLGYEVGVRINLDVLNAQSQLYQSQKELAQARYELLLGLLQLHQAAGTLGMQEVQAVNAVLSPAALQADPTPAGSQEHGKGQPGRPV